MKRLLLFGGVAILLTMFLVSSANAFAVKFETRDYFAWGRLYNPTTGVATNLNPFDNSNTQTLALDTYMGIDGTEDAFGITAITRITNTAGTVTYWEESSSQELTALFWDADDVLLTSAGIGGTSTLVSSGFRIDLWLDNTPDYDVTAGTAGRTDSDSYTTVTDDGTLVLSLAGHTQFLDWSSGTTTQPYTLLENGDPASGNYTGSILFDVIGGTWAPWFDTDTQIAGNNNTLADFTFSFSTFSNPNVSDWIIGDTSNAVGDFVPEPATISLLGLGLLSVAFIGRKRSFKK